MYAHNLFTLNNIPTLSVGGGLGASLLESGDGQLTVRRHDVVFVNVVQYGRTLLDKAFTGFSGITKLLMAVKECLGATAGLVTVNFRNRTCGGTARRVIRLNRPTMTMPRF